MTPGEREQLCWTGTDCAAVLHMVHEKQAAAKQATSPEKNTQRGKSPEHGKTKLPVADAFVTQHNAESKAAFGCCCSFLWQQRMKKAGKPPFCGLPA